MESNTVPIDVIPYRQKGIKCYYCRADTFFRVIIGGNSIIVCGGCIERAKKSLTNDFLATKFGHVQEVGESPSD